MSPHKSARFAFVALLALLCVGLACLSATRPAAAQTLTTYGPFVASPDTVWSVEGLLVSFDVSAAASEPITSFTAGGSAPDAGASFTVTSESNTTGHLSWTPNLDQSGTYSVTFTASNTLSGSKATVIVVADAPTIDLTTSGASVTDAQGVLWSEGSGGAGGTGVFAPFLREQKDSIEIAFNTDAVPVPFDGKVGAWTHSLTFGSLATVTVGDRSYYSFRLDANELGSSPEERICLDDLKIFRATGPAIPDSATLVNTGTLLYQMASNQEVHVSTSLHPGSGAVDMTVLIPTYYFDVSSSAYLYLYASFGNCTGAGLHTSDGFEEWSALQIATDHPPVVTAPLDIVGEEGGDISFGVTASDPDSDPISSLTANRASLPEGNDASFVTNAGNTAGTFHWHMNVGNAGSYNVTFTATANALSSSSTTKLNVGPAGINVSGVFTWTPQAGQQGDYNIIFSATDEGGTTTATSTIHVVSPILSPAPSAPLAPRAPGVALAPLAAQKGPIISATASATTIPGTPVTLDVYASTAPPATVLAAAPIRLSARAVQTTTLSADASALPPGNNATFVVDNQPVVTAPATRNADPGVPMSVTVTAQDPDSDPIDFFTADLSALPAGNPGSYSVSADHKTLTVTWTPRLADVGTYVLRFTASNRLVGTGSTTVTVRAAAPALVFLLEPVKINTGAARSTQCTQIEPVSRSFALTDVNFSTIKMISFGTGAVTEIRAVMGKTSVLDDRNRNGIAELTACFYKADLRALFSLITTKSTVPVTIQGQLLSGAYFTGTMNTDINPGATPTVGSASVVPNPLNPQAKLNLNLGKGGWLKVNLYDMQGRLVRELANETNVAPGPRQILIDGMDSEGLPLASGVYYYRVQSADGVHNGRLAIVR